jgi:4-hydroxyproline epimerase
VTTRRIQVIDSHTGGEPTRVVIAGGPQFPPGSLTQKRDAFRVQHDAFRAAVVNEPRGSDVLVGALLTEPADSSCAMGVIFFNNIGTIGMCGHGTIGLVTTLAHLGKIRPGTHRIETPVGVVTAILHENGEVTVQNVASYRHRKAVGIEVEGYGAMTGDVAWGGNWFFLVENHRQELEPSNIDKLLDCTWKIRQALVHNGITGKDGMEIDHIELIAPSKKPGIHSKNFVLCPGRAYDRSPCGTGTSAKLACLVADGKFKPGDIWRQESIIGSVFEGSVQIVGSQVIPSIKGSAFITGEATLILEANDPWCHGIRT